MKDTMLGRESTVFMVGKIRSFYRELGGTNEESFYDLGIPVELNLSRLEDGLNKYFFGTPGNSEITVTLTQLPQVLILHGMFMQYDLKTDAMANPPGLSDKEISHYETLIDLVKALHDPKQQPRVVAITDLAKDYDDLAAMVVLKELHRFNVVELQGFIANLIPAERRAQFGQGALDSLGLQDIPMAQGTSAFPTPAREKHSEVSYEFDSDGKDDKIRRKGGGVELLQRLCRNAIKTEQKLTLMPISSLEDIYTFSKNNGDLVGDAVGNIVLPRGNTISTEGINSHYDMDAAKTFRNFTQECKIPSGIYTNVAAFVTPLTSHLFDKMANTKYPLGKYLRSLQEYQDISFYETPMEKSNTPDKRFAPFMDQKWFLKNKPSWFDVETESTNMAKEGYSLNEEAGFGLVRGVGRGKWKTLSMPLKTSFFKRKALRLLLNGEECFARPDTGSEKNVMTEETAKKHGIPISRSEADKNLFQLGTGRYIQSIGRAYVPYRFFDDGSSSEYGWFHILKQCAAPLIIGMEFINKIKLYTKRKHLLVDCPSSFGSIPILKWIGSPQGRINFSAGDQSFVGCADTGSDLDFMSLYCAMKSGFEIDRRASQRTRVMIADGTIVETVGKVRVTSMLLGSFQLFDMEFHVLPGLPTEVIFSEEFLDRIDAFNTCTELMDTEDPYQHSLNTLINLGPIQAFLSRTWTPEASDTVQQEHDNKIETEFHRRNKARRAILRIVGSCQSC